MGSLSAACLLLACLSSGHGQARFMPYIYPSGSVLQFAMGLALPADVKGRNVATNSGILINIDLPTNLSQLRPPARSARSLTAHPLLALSADPAGCLLELECYRRKFSEPQGLLPEILNSILESVLRGKEDLTRIGLMTPDDCASLYSCNSPYVDLIRSIYTQFSRSNSEFP